MNIEDIFLPKKRRYYIIFFIFISLITIFFSLGITNLQTNNDISVLLPVNEETEFEREKIRRLGKEFSAEQLLFVGVTGDPFSLKNIKVLWQLCNDLEKLKVVDSTLNPFNSTYFKKTGPVAIPVQMSIKQYPKTEAALKQFMENITSNRYLIGSVISYDKKTAGIVVRANYNAMMGKEVVKKNLFMRFSEFAFGTKYGPKKIDRTYFCNQVESVLKKYDKSFKIYFAGVPVYEAKSKVYMQRDIYLLIIPVLIVMTLVFFLSFRTFRGTVLPLISIGLSILWTMGLIGWFRYKLDTVGILIAPLIMTVGSSYTLHYLNSYYNHSSEFKDSRDLVFNSTKAIFPTIFIASVTTMVGFASFITARIAPIRSFGVFIIISISFTLFFTFFLLSKILTKFDPPKMHRMHKVHKDFFSKILTLFRESTVPLKYFWVGIYLGTIILFFIFIPNLKIETNAANLFKRSDNVRKSLIFLQYNFHGTNHYNITLRSTENKRNYFKSREGLLAAKKIQDYFDKGVKIDGNDMIGWMLSPVTLIEDFNMKIDGRNDIPEDEVQIKRFFTLLQLKSEKNDLIKSIINDDFSAITFQIRPHTTNTVEDFIMTEQELAKLSKKLSVDLQKIASQDKSFTVEIWGEILLLSSISKYLVKDQVWSLSITVLLVFLITLLIFKSPYYAFFSLIPLSFGVLMNFTLMSIFKIPLDASTALIAAISIGIGVDDSIHFILHYKKAIKQGHNAMDSVIHTLVFTARPILFTSLALIFGFLVFLISSFKPVGYFGMLIAISMFNCTFATLFILPSFFIVTDKIRQLFHKHA